MKTTVRKIIGSIDCQGGLSKLARLDLPPKIAYKIGRLLESANSSMKELQKDRKDLFDKYGEPLLAPDGTDTNQIKINLNFLPSLKRNKMNFSIRKYQSGTNQ